MVGRNKQSYEFGPFRIDRDERILLREGKPVPLAPKAFDVLLALVENSGHIVAKEELMNKVWADTFVEEGNLKVTVSVLRKALDDAHGQPRFIETVPKRGYRFVANVSDSVDRSSLVLLEETRSSVIIEENETDCQEDPGHARIEKPPAANSVSGATSAPISNSVAVQQSGIRRSTRVALPVAAALTALGAIVLVLFLANRKPADRFEAMRMVRYGESGEAKLAAISPDGRYLATSSREGGRERLLVTQVASGIQAEIEPPAEVKYMGLLFSDDGNYVYYTVNEENGTSSALFRVSVLGGPSKKLKEGLASPPSFSPDRARFAFVRESRNVGESALMVSDADGNDERKIIAHKLPDFLDYPAWSPDGKTIACTVVNSTTGYHVDVVQVGVQDGAERPLASRTWGYVEQLKWLKDGRGLVMSAREQGSRNFQIWRISYPRGEAQRITNDLNSYEGVSVTADSNALVTVDMSMHSSIWAAPAPDIGLARQIVSRVSAYSDPVWTLDEKIVFALPGINNRELWVMDADGSNHKRLTVDAGNVSGPDVSPEGDYIVFTSDAAGRNNIWRIDANGGNRKQLTNGADENRPRCSPDGKWVLFTSFDPAGHQHMLHRVPIEGGDSVQVTDFNSSSADISTDMKLIACFRLEAREGTDEKPAAIYVIPFEGGAPLKVLKPWPAPSHSVGLHWTRDNRSLTYVSTSGGVSNIWEQPLDGGSARQLTDFKSDLISSFAWSRNGSLVCVRGAAANDIILITNLR